MLLGRLFPILIVIILFVDVSAGAARVRTVRRIFCFGNYKLWFCFGDEKCGTTYESCISDPPLETSSTRDTIGGIVFLILWFGLCIFSFWYRSYRRRRIEKNFIRCVQTAVAEVQQPRTVYVVVDRSVPNEPSTNEQPPPSYEQIQK